MTHAPVVEIAEHALAVLGTLLGDYTDPDEDGHCARVVVIGGSVGEGYFDVQVHRALRAGEASAAEKRGDPPPTYRVSVVVGPAPAPVSLQVVRALEAPRRGERG